MLRERLRWDDSGGLAADVGGDGVAHRGRDYAEPAICWDGMSAWDDKRPCCQRRLR